MIVVEKNEGAKIPYEVKKQKICFDDDLTINLARRQGDEPEHIDVCSDADGNLVIGAAAGRAYVAEIDIPAREYERSDDAPSDGEGIEDGEGGGSASLTPLPLDMAKVKLTLWALV